jgi:hypothetical protein
MVSEAVGITFVDVPKYTVAMLEKSFFRSPGLVLSHFTQSIHIRMCRGSYTQ